jgi:tetratricopeptide (TPR) repeat protein
MENPLITVVTNDDKRTPFNIANKLKLSSSTKKSKQQKELEKNNKINSKMKIACDNSSECQIKTPQLIAKKDGFVAKLFYAQQLLDENIIPFNILNKTLLESAQLLEEKLRITPNYDEKKTAVKFCEKMVLGKRCENLFTHFPINSIPETYYAYGTLLATLAANAEDFNLDTNENIKNYREKAVQYLTEAINSKSLAIAFKENGQKLLSILEDKMTHHRPSMLSALPDEERKKELQKLEKKIKDSQNVNWKDLFELGYAYCPIIDTKDQKDYQKSVYYFSQLLAETNQIITITHDEKKSKIALAALLLGDMYASGSKKIKKNYNIARDYYEKANSLGNKNGLLKKAITYYQEGLYDNALFCLENIIADQTIHATMDWYKGLIYLIKGNKEKAKNFFFQAIDLDSDYQFLFSISLSSRTEKDLVHCIERLENDANDHNKYLGFCCLLTLSKIKPNHFLPRLSKLAEQGYYPAQLFLSIQAIKEKKFSHTIASYLMSMPTSLQHKAHTFLMQQAHSGIIDAECYAISFLNDEEILTWLKNAPIERHNTKNLIDGGSNNPLPLIFLKKREGLLDVLAKLSNNFSEASLILARAHIASYNALSHENGENLLKGYIYLEKALQTMSELEREQFKEYKKAVTFSLGSYYYSLKYTADAFKYFFESYSCGEKNAGFIMAQILLNLTVDDTFYKKYTDLHPIEYAHHLLKPLLNIYTADNQKFEFGKMLINIGHYYQYIKLNYNNALECYKKANELGIITGNVLANTLELAIKEKHLKLKSIIKNKKKNITENNIEKEEENIESLLQSVENYLNADKNTPYEKAKSCFEQAVELSRNNKENKKSLLQFLVRFEEQQLSLASLPRYIALNNMIKQTLQNYFIIPRDQNDIGSFDFLLNSPLHKVKHADPS